MATAFVQITDPVWPAKFSVFVLLRWEGLKQATIGGISRDHLAERALFAFAVVLTGGARAPTSAACAQTAINLFGSWRRLIREVWKGRGA